MTQKSGSTANLQKFINIHIRIYKHLKEFAGSVLFGAGMLVLFFITMVRAQEKIVGPQEAASLLREVVITSVSQVLPLTVVTDPKTSRQPVPASDGADYLKTIPGFSVIRNGGTNGDPVLRGMFGSRLNIVSDGSVILGACPGRMDNPSSYISPENYDRLTVIKGPQTVRWGPTGSAGTVLFERDPQHFRQFTTKANGSILYGTDGRLDTRIDATIGDKPGYVRFIGNKSLAHDYHDGGGNRIPSKWDKWNGDLFIGWTPDADTVLELGGGLGDGEARYAGRGMDGTQFKRKSLSAKFIRTDVNDILDKVEAQIYYNYADHIMDNFRLRDLKPGSSGRMPWMEHMGGMGHMPGMVMESELDRRTLGSRFAATWNWGDFSLVTGVDAQTDTHRAKNSRNIRVTSGWNRDAAFNNYGAFGELTWFLTSDQRIIAGAGIDWASVEDYRKKSLTGGDKRSDILPGGFLRYEQDFENIPVTAYIGIGHAERFPDYWELFSPQMADSGHLNAFDGIKPEKTTQIDLGAQYSTADTDLWASVYVGRIQDYILFDYTSGKSRAINVDATIMGGEAGVSHYLSETWKADVSLAYAWGRNSTDKEALPQIPPLETRLGLTCRQENWSIGALWRLVMEQGRIARDKGNVVGKDYDKISGFGIFSLNGSYKINDNFRLTGGIDNLFNKQYAEHLNRDGEAGFGFPAHYQLREPGRTFWAKADFTF